MRTDPPSKLMPKKSEPIVRVSDIKLAINSSFLEIPATTRARYRLPLTFSAAYMEITGNDPVIKNLHEALVNNQITSELPSDIHMIYLPAKDNSPATILALLPVTPSGSDITQETAEDAMIKMHARIIRTFTRNKLKEFNEAIAAGNDHVRFQVVGEASQAMEQAILALISRDIPKVAALGR